MSPSPAVTEGNGASRAAARRPKFATIGSVIDSNRGRLQEGSPPGSPTGGPQGGSPDAPTGGGSQPPGDSTQPPGGGTQPPGEGSPEKLYLEHLATIEKAAAHACRAYGFSREEIEDFTQQVKIKIWADNYAVLRKWQGRSSLPTYLVTVVQRALQDHVNHLWGKWRPSEEARRLGRRFGTLPVDLETLLVRDHYSFSEACQVLWIDRGVKATEAELIDLAARLPSRSPRRLDSRSGAGGGTAGAAGDPQRRSSEPAPLAFAAAAEAADERVWSRERARRRQRAWEALDAALQGLPAEDRLIAKLSARLKTVEIARRLGRDQKRLYKRMERILETLRQAIERAGVSAEDVAEILGHADT
jgi:RNA polymerase sigma factor (sigma-70 family)